MDVDALRRHAGLNPLPPDGEDEPDPDAPMCKHGCATMPCRHTRTEDKHKKHIGKELRGVPLVGAGPGAIDGTVPGQGSVADLELAARDIRLANEALARAKAEQLRKVRRDLKRNEPTRI